MRKRCLWALWIAALAVPVGATTLARMKLGQLAAAATAIVRARCLGNRSDWESGEIWTRTRFQTLERFKGGLPGQFTVRLIGGHVGGIESIVGDVPRFRPGQEVILFLDPSKAGAYSVTAWVEGTFVLRRDRSGHAFVTQESAGEAVYDPATRQFHAEGIRHMPLNVFRQRLRNAMGGAASSKIAVAPRPGQKAQQ